jgi:acyl transferase domain-containing protein
MTGMMTSIMGLLAEGRIDRPTAQRLVEAARADPPPTREGGTEAIAVIGVAAQLPGATTYERFWDVLMAGEDRVEPAPERRRQLCAPVLSKADGAPSFLTAAWVEDVDLFDPGFFGLTPADARAMDPQQRRFYQTAYHCLEDAGLAGRVRGTRTGVYVSAAGGDYTGALPEITPSAVPGVLPSFTASRLSFILDLHGPAFVTSATCASSLLALHEACLGLRNGDCETALVGGVNLFTLPVATSDRLMDAAGIVSDDHRSRPFDQGGAGIGRGEGVIALLLKPMRKAVEDGDPVRAVIRASAVNNDGASAALTAPNPKAHTELLLDAWRQAEVSPETLSYIETHGTGTALGDPIEIRGITDAVRRHTNRRQFIAAGSVKGNIGHLVDGVAGLSGLVKAILVLRHGCVPATVNLREPNRHIDFLDSPVFVPTEPWDLRADSPHGGPLRAGVSCFGFNGTNVHVVLEEPPRSRDRGVRRPHRADGRPLVFPLSARTWASLRALVAAYGADGGAAGAVDVAYSLWRGREHHRCRLAVLATDRAEFADVCRRLTHLETDGWGDDPKVWTAAGPNRTDTPEAGLAHAYVMGQETDWRFLFDTDPPPALVDLPLYPFDEDSYWHRADAVTPAPAPLGTDTLSCLLASVAQALGHDEVTARDSFIGLGGTSLSAMQIQVSLLRDHNWQIDAADLLGAKDFIELASVIEAAHTPESADLHESRR